MEEEAKRKVRGHRAWLRWVCEHGAEKKPGKAGPLCAH